MKKIGLILSVVAILSVGIFSACNKQKEAKLVGEWTLVGGTSATTETYDYFFTFTDEKVTITTREKGSLERETCATGNYVVKNNVLTIAAPTRFCQYITYDGDWDIETLNDDVLVIRQTGNGANTLEFVK